MHGIKGAVESDRTEDRSRTVSSANQPFIAILIAALALAIVTSLMLFAVRRTSVTAKVAATEGEKLAPETYGRYLAIERYVASLRTNVIGARELQIRGFVRNAGRMTVRSADLRCVFQTKNGMKISFDIPLVVESRMQDIGNEPLMPFSGRPFDVRIPNLPENVVPEILETDIVKIKFLDR